jgi:hypothetical protein
MTSASKLGLGVATMPVDVLAQVNLPLIEKVRNQSTESGKWIAVLFRKPEFPNLRFLPKLIYSEGGVSWVFLVLPDKSGDIIQLTPCQLPYTTLCMS